MNKTLFLIVTLLISCHALAQNQKWEVYHGYSNQNASCNDIIEIYDRGLMIAGQAGSPGWNIKVSTNGSKLYDKLLFHADCIATSWAIEHDPLGNVYVGGMLACEGVDEFPYIAKFDPCGEKIWCRHFPNSECIYGGGVLDILINSKNEIIVLMYYPCGNIGDQIYLAGLNENGDQLWKKSYASKNNYPPITNPIAYNIIELNNEYYIAGDCYWPYPNNPNHVFLRPLFIGVDNNFNEKWIIPFSVLDSVFGEARTILPINDSMLMGIGYRYLEGFNTNTLIMYFNTRGEELGYFQIPNDVIGSDIDFNAVREIERINDTLFLSPVYMGIGGQTYFGELVYDDRGGLYKNSIRSKYFYNGASTKTSDNNFVIGIPVVSSQPYSKIFLYKINADLESVPFDTTQYVYDSLCPHPIQSGTIDLTDCLVITSIDELPSPDEYYESIRWIPLKAYPNPVSGLELTIEFENTQHHSNMELRLYDAFGKEMHRRRIYTGQQDTRLDVGHWPPGLYLGVVYSNGGAVGRCKVMVE